MIPCLVTSPYREGGANMKGNRMTKQTRAIIESAISLDGTMAEAEKAAILASLDGGRGDGDEVLPVAEVARRLHRTPKTVHLLARQNLLKKVTFGKQSRASGILASSLAALLKGGAA